jgi:hypothetical protein
VLVGDSGGTAGPCLQCCQSSRFSKLIRNEDTYFAIVKGEVILRPTVSRPVCLDVGLPSGSQDQFFFCLIIAGFLCGAPSLTRGWVRNLFLQLLLGLVRLITLGSNAPRTRDHILLPHLRLSPTWTARSPYLYPPGIRFPSRRLLRLTRLRCRYLNSPSRGGEARGEVR